MVLQQIVETLDQELLRLGRLREIIAGLGKTAVVSRPGKAAVEAAAAEPVSPAPQASRVRRSFERGTRKTRGARVVERPQTALTSAIPSGPVVVSASAVAKENAAKKLARAVAPKVQEGTLGAMIRALGPQGAV